MRIVWLHTAQQQMEEIYDFIARQNPKAAADIYNNLIDEADILADFPEMAPLEPSLGGQGRPYRSLTVQRIYKVVYRADTARAEIIIVSVWDCRRDPEILKETK